MKRIIIVCFLFGGLSLVAENPELDLIGKQLLKRAPLDRDAFGAGNAKGVTPTLEARILQAKSDLRIQVIESSMVEPDEDPALAGTQIAGEMFLKSAFLNSDLVAVAMVTRQASVFNSTKRGIITEALVKVQEVFYSKPGTSVAENGDIYLARPGGTIIVGEHKISVKDDTFPDFSVGSKYLMFLKRDALTNSYRIEKTSAFQLNGESVKPINPTGPHPAEAFMVSTDGFVTTVRNRARDVQK